VRNPAKAAMRLAHLPVEFHGGDVRDRESLEKALRGCGSVVHLAAIAIEKPGQSYADVNAEATKTLIAAARLAGVERLVFVSQNGADSSSPHAFLRSKGQAEDAVTQSGLAYTVLRPSVIFGPEDEFINVLGRLVKLTPFVFPLPDGGKARFQPVSAADVAKAIRLSLESKVARGAVYSLGGPSPLTLREMTEIIFAAMGTFRTIVGVPVSALRPLLAFAARVIPNPPVTPELLDLLGLDNTVPKNALTETFGIAPTPFAPDELHYLRRITVSSALRSLFERR
jgi:uncharacterized protein YbjT (DUF2867 family)